jgi:hypothetical protein
MPQRSDSWGEFAMPDELKPDPKALEEWRNLPQGEPSPEAMPPAVGGQRWVFGLLIVAIFLTILMLVAQGSPA